MECPNDKTGMEKGLLSDYGTSWSKDQGLIGLQNKMPKLGIKISAYRCPKCGKIELNTEISK